MREQISSLSSGLPLSIIREAENRDLPGIREIQKSAGRADTESFAQSILQSVIDPSRLLIVAEVDRVLVGWASTMFFATDDENGPAGHYLMGITVAPQSRRRGIGGTLTAARLTWISRLADRAFYFANSSNQSSIDAHKPWGFHEIARADQFHGVTFTGGEGILFQCGLPYERRGALVGRD